MGGEGRLALTKKPLALFLVQPNYVSNYGDAGNSSADIHSPHKSEAP